jgi:hypothetical protein
MATIEDRVYAVLSGSAGVTALCPAARIKPEGVYQNLALPYIRHFAVSLSPIQTHGGMATLKRWPYQIAMFAASASSLVALRTAVMAALEASKDPRFFITGMVNFDNGELSTDIPIVGQALLIDAWYE